MKVLIACEFSGVVRRAFRDRGHDAWSCDLLPAEDGSRFHYQCDLRSVFNMGGPFEDSWDLMIAHPPCTRLCNSGVRWLHKPPSGKTWNDMHMELKDAALFFRQIWVSPIKRIAIENPIMHKWAKEEMPEVPDYAQIIQPWQFGEGETKGTCLWLKDLPKLIPTKIVEGRTARVHRASPGPDRWKERSRTFVGIANAMADQWGSLDA